MIEPFRMPVVFVGHGSPLYTLEHQGYIQSWRNLGQQLPTPKGIVCISAHWVTEKLMILCNPINHLIYDFYGFPKELYQVSYPTSGPEGIQGRVSALLAEPIICGDWGLDHGTWSVLRHIYPDGQIPVTQISIPSHYTATEVWELGKKLSVLRDEGYLIMGSGNIIHNLGLMDQSLENQGTPWAEQLRVEISQALVNRDDQKLIHFEQFGPDIHKAFRTTEHYYPLLAVLGTAEGDTNIQLFNDHCVFGSLSMTSLVIGSLNYE